MRVHLNNTMDITERISKLMKGNKLCAQTTRTKQPTTNKQTNKTYEKHKRAAIFTKEPCVQRLDNRRENVDKTFVVSERMGKTLVYSTVTLLHRVP